MKIWKLASFVIVLLLPAIAVGPYAVDRSLKQQEAKVPVCKAAVLAVLKPPPKLSYRCTAKYGESDEKILRLPGRVRAIKVLTGRLESFTDSAWWQADVEDINACDLRKAPGILSDDEKQRFQGGDYQVTLFGDHQIRLMLARDPCYQTEWNGMNVFLLYHKQGRVFATDVLDGFYSRADNPLRMDLADLNGERVVEVSTWTGGLNPEGTNYYFVFDRKTNKAVPKNLFKSDHGLTNQITSAILLSEPESLDLPDNAGELKVIRDGKLAKDVSVYREDTDGKIDDNGRTLTRSILRWNGSFYQ